MKSGIQLRKLEGGIATLRILDGREHAAKLAVAIEHELYGRAIAGGDFLFDVRNSEIVRPCQITAIGTDLATDRREQARLAGAVGACQADLVAARHGEVHLLEKRLRTAPQSEIPSD
ncbi:MAG: hypothetical protein NVSMB10_02820 [Steroidobacteraceae bacterium]